MQKKLGQIWESEQNLEIWKFGEFEILPEFFHKNQDNLLNFQDMGLIFYI